MYIIVLHAARWPCTRLTEAIWKEISDIYTLETSGYQACHKTQYEGQLLEGDLYHIQCAGQNSLNVLWDYSVLPRENLIPGFWHREEMINPARLITSLYEQRLLIRDVSPREMACTMHTKTSLAEAFHPVLSAVYCAFLLKCVHTNSHTKPAKQPASGINTLLPSNTDLHLYC